MPDELDPSLLTDEELRFELDCMLREKREAIRRIDDLDTEMIGIREEQRRRKIREQERALEGKR